MFNSDSLWDINYINCYITRINYTSRTETSSADLKKSLTTLYPACGDESLLTFQAHMGIMISFETKLFIARENKTKNKECQISENFY
jgi:hypothetical protein